ncbi:hypothetical protein FB451DRAFT_1062493 [Mycena latifolia]|nr:hypothetical protein FB451DRAFT_1062493 [Mycena latifolia]
MLIWIKGALSPQEIQEKMLAADGDFQRDMVAYLESCHVGEFLTGMMAEVKAKFPYHAKNRKGLHDVMVDEVRTAKPIRYVDPTQTLPTPPPPLCEGCKNALCQNCLDLNNWWLEHDDTVDDVVMRSNVHSCRRCMRKDGSCSARFPRDIILKTVVDPADGAIHMKKLEPMINCIVRTISPLKRSHIFFPVELLTMLTSRTIMSYVSRY